jgi:hypothetical protein
MICLTSYSQLIKAALVDDPIKWRALPDGCIQSDFLNSYCAALLGRDARRQGLNIYDIDTQVRVQKTILAPEPYPFEKPFYFQYPPTIFVAAVPLANLPMGQAWVLYWIMGLALSAASLWLLLSSVKASKAECWLATLGLFSSYPILESCRMGQPAFCLLPVLTAIWLLLTARNFFFAGLATALFTFKIQYLIPVVVAGLALGKLRYLLGCSLGFIVIFTLCVMQLGWANVMNFPQALRMETSSSIVGVQAWAMQNFRGQLFMLRGRIPEDLLSHILVLVFFAVIVVTVGIMWWRGRNKSESDLRIYASITTILMLLASPHTHAHDYVIAIIPFIWLWKASKDAYPGWQSSSLKWLFLMFPLISWIMWWRQLIVFSPVKVTVWRCLTGLLPLLYSLGLWGYADQMESTLTQLLTIPIHIFAAIEPYVLWMLPMLWLGFREARKRNTV